MTQVYASSGGINDAKECLETNCDVDLYQILDIYKQNDTADLFVKDVFTGATMFIGTVVTISLIASGGILIFAGADEKWADKGKKGIYYSIIGLLLVIFSYGIIKTAQFLAKG